MRRRFMKKVLSVLLMIALLATFFPVSDAFAETLPGGVTEIIFTTRTFGNDAHWYANNGYWCADETKKLYGKQGRLCKLNVATGKVTTLLEDLEGCIRDPQVSYDATKILFSYRPGGTEQFHIYEINADGTGLRQITFGLYDDIEPIYLPDDDIMFNSSRCKRYTPCWVAQTLTMFRCDANGQNIRAVSVNHDQDNTPWMMPDGRIMYTRWEYTDRSQMVFHHLWTMNQDGSDQQIAYGNMHADYDLGILGVQAGIKAGTVMIDAKPIPGTNKVVCVFGPGHGVWEHNGFIKIVDLSNGPDDLSKFKTIATGLYMDPYPIADNCYLAATGLSASIIKLDNQGSQTTLYSNPLWTLSTVFIQEPRPLVPRSREPITSNHVNPTATTGKLLLQDVNVGRNMGGVAPAEIKKLLIVEDLPKPVSFDGAQMPISYNSKFYVTRILGTVPVEPDGSAFFEVPADRPLTFVALDENNNSVKRMMSFTTVQKGETLSCIGCHETRETAPPSGEVPLAFRAPSPVQITPLPENIPEIYDFPRDVQPVLDKYCISCHNPDNRQGGVILTGDYSTEVSLSYYTLAVRKQFFVGGDMEKGNYAPRKLGDPVSPIMWKLGDRQKDVTLVNAFSNDTTVWPSLVEKSGTNPHYGINMTQAERDVIKYWVNTGGQYAGTYASQGPQGVFPWMEQNEPRGLLTIQSVDDAESVIKNRCNSCHTGDNALPTRIDQHEPFFGDNWSGINDSQLDNPKRSKHASDLIYNLSKPEKSVQLLAPLAQSAGGYGICKKNGNPVFSSTSDPDYQTLLKCIEDVKEILNEKKRFDMVDFIPNRQWVREMKKYGLIPVDLNPYETTIDYYDIERQYYESMWAKAGATMQWGAEDAQSGAAELSRFNQVLSLAPYQVPVNIAKGSPVSVSSNRADTVSEAAYMTDGNSRTAWSSAAANNEWAYLDLGMPYPINRVKLAWDTDYGSSYKIQVSNDAENWTDVYAETNGDGRVDDIRFNSVTAQYIKVQGITSGTSSGYSLLELYAFLDKGPNIALNQTASSSSNENNTYTAAKAVDGDSSTRWSSQSGDPQWITVDLGASYNVYAVKLNWEAAYAKAYKIQVSADGNNWTDVYSTTRGVGGTEEMAIHSTSPARYVRMYGIQRATSHGYSLYDFEVYGSLASQTAAPQLLAQWLFNGNGDDNTGNGHSAALHDVAYSANAAEGSSAASFNGTSSYIDLGSFDLGNNFSISMWVCTDAAISNAKTLIANSGSGESTDGFRFMVNTPNSTDKKLKFETGNGSSQNYANSYSTTAEFGVWKHVALTVNQVTGMAEIYWNGVKTTLDGSILTNFNTNTTLNLGRMTNNTYLYNGLMDDVRIYSGTLSDSDIRALSGNTDLALYKTAFASSEENSDLTAGKATDGIYDTRWGSDWSNPQWIYVDLGSSTSVGRVKLTWEEYAKNYKIQVSDDSSVWTDVYSTTTGDGGVDDITFTPVNCRYVRMYGLEKNGIYGFSVRNFEVFVN